MFVVEVKSLAFETIEIPAFGTQLQIGNVADDSPETLLVAKRTNGRIKPFVLSDFTTDGLEIIRTMLVSHPLQHHDTVGRVFQAHKGIFGFSHLYLALRIALLGFECIPDIDSRAGIFQAGDDIRVLCQSFPLIPYVFVRTEFAYAVIRQDSGKKIRVCIFQRTHIDFRFNTGIATAFEQTAQCFIQFFLTLTF